MTLREFYKKLEEHDWFWVYADDGRAYREGRHAEGCLLSEASEAGAEYLALFNAYYEATFSGPTWGTAKLPLPKIPD